MSPGVGIPGLSRRLRGEVYDHVYDNHAHEVGGVLVGDLGEGEMPVVSGCIAALEARGERASVTFTHDAWSSIHSQMESDYPGKQIVGWYHSHPGFGIFLSGHDIFIQENFFSDPRQIAYVVDPHAGTEGVFGWRAGKVELLEQAPAGRQGTGGPGPPPGQSTRSGDLLRYGGLAAVVLVFVAIGGALFVAEPAPQEIIPPVQIGAQPTTLGTPEPTNDAVLAKLVGASKPPATPETQPAAGPPPPPPSAKAPAGPTPAPAKSTPSPKTSGD